MQNHKELLDSAITAAKLAAQHIRSVERPSHPSSWGQKGTSDFVTQVDRDCEQLIADSLLRDHPNSTIMGEELSPQTTHTAEGVTWVVDPLDGTTNYLHDYPAYAVSVAAMLNGVLSAGVVIDVLRERVYHSTFGGGAWCDDRRIQVSATTDTAIALIGTGFPFKSLHLLPEYLHQFTTILKATSGIRRAGSAALDLVDLASGRLDGFWELSLAPWDVAAGTLLVREAGGVVTDTEGHRDVIRQGPVIAGNPAIHSWLLEVVKSDDS
ncbi:inositol monophosphatase family protein [Gemmatimonadota bacterium]